MKGGGWRTWIASRDQRTRASVCGKEQKRAVIVSWEICVASGTGGALCEGEKKVDWRGGKRGCGNGARPLCETQGEKGGGGLGMSMQRCLH